MQMQLGPHHVPSLLGTPVGEGTKGAKETQPINEPCQMLYDSVAAGGCLTAATAAAVTSSGDLKGLA